MTTAQEDRLLERSRMRTLAIICASLFVILAGRLWYLQIAAGNRLLVESEMNRKRLIRVRAPRGMILDRKGRILATSRPQFVVMAVPEILKANPQAMKTLCGVLNVTQQELMQIMTKDRAAKLAPVRVAIDVPLDVVAKLQERRPILPGVDVELDQLRSYPDGPLAAHVLGYIGEINEKELEKFRDSGVDRYKPGDYIGKSGIEKQYEELLHGEDGGQEIEVDVAGRTRRILGNKAPIPGATLTLTIDKDLQIAAEKAMAGKTGAAVAIDPQTGEVLAMVSKPDFDPNIFVKRVKVADWNKIILNKQHPLQNRAIGAKYPPGSTFKPVTGTAALQDGVATANTSLVCTGVGWYHRRCWKVHGHVTFITAISQSCDVFFYEMGHRLGIDRLAAMARGFGLSYATGIDLPEEVRKAGDTHKGTIPDPAWKAKWSKEPWQAGETVIAAIGQGYVETTPLQMSQVAGAIPMMGKIFGPHVLLKVQDPDGKVVQKVKGKLKRQVPASEANFKIVQYAMRQTVVGPGGTGHVVDIPGVAIGGKTGSAEMPGKKPNAWFICFAEVDKPKIAIAVIAEQGWHGATAAAPVARAILDVYYGKVKPTDVKSTVAHVRGD